MITRRNFTKISIGLASAPGYLSSIVSGKDIATVKAEPFKALFAPSADMMDPEFKSYKDKMQAAYDLGFRAWEDNWLAKKDLKTWEVIAEFCRDKKMQMGVSVITAGKGYDFSNLTSDQNAKLDAEIKLGIEMSKVTGHTFMTYLPGGRNAMTREEQIVKVAETVKRHCDMVEEHGIILCNEPVSHKIFKVEPLLQTFRHGHALCKAVNRKSCKLLADFYHEGEMGLGDKFIENAEAVWDEVAYVQYGDSPGRKEPGTGELDYVKVTKWLREKGYTGIIGMEHGLKNKDKQGREAMVQAYRAIDA